MGRDSPGVGMHVDTGIRLRISLVNSIILMHNAYKQLVVTITVTYYIHLFSFADDAEVDKSTATVSKCMTISLLSS